MLKNRTIYIFSPERWGTMKLSKHHYAIELSNQGNVVYFLEPAVKKLKHLIVQKIDQNLNIVQYPLIARGKDRLPKFIYNYLLHLEVKKMIKGIGMLPDLIWSFDPIRLDRFHFFKSAIRIFHSVDFFGHITLPKRKFRNFFFSPITKQVEEFENYGYKSFYINHGLSKHFIPFAEKNIQQLKQKQDSFTITKTINAGYVGNLISEPPDKETMKEVIIENENVHFHFWGQYERKNSSLPIYDYPEVFNFIEFLKRQTNVTLYGSVDTHNLASKIQNMDMFWICWKISESSILWNKYTNPHKLIEYLSTGKPIVAHHIYNYKDNDLLYSLESEDNSQYVSLFKNVVNIVKKGENCLKEMDRIKYALDNTYKKHVIKIEKIINDNQAFEINN